MQSPMFDTAGCGEAVVWTEASALQLPGLAAQTARPGAQRHHETGSFRLSSLLELSCVWAVKNACLQSAGLLISNLHDFS